MKFVISLLSRFSFCVFSYGRLPLVAASGIDPERAHRRHVD